MGTVYDNSKTEDITEQEVGLGVMLNSKRFIWSDKPLTVSKPLAC